MSLLIFGQGSAPTQLDAVDLVAKFLSLLNANNADGLSAANETEIFEFLSEALTRLSMSVSGFVVRDATLTISGAVATVAMPTRHISTIHASIDSDDAGAWQPLIPTSVNELEAADESWETAAGTPSRFTHDQEDTNTLRVYKIPADDTGLAVIYHEEKAAVADGSSTFYAPAPVQDHMMYDALAQIRGQENDEAMPEVAKYCQGRADAFLEIFRQYWGAQP